MERGTVIYFTGGEGVGGAFIAAPAFEKAGAAERGAGEAWGVRWDWAVGEGGEPAHTCIAEEGNTCAPRGSSGGVDAANSGVKTDQSAGPES